MNWLILATVAVFFIILLPGKMDSTDKSYWKRSGMHLYTDYGTGLQYLSAPGFSRTLIPRLDKDGKHMSIQGEESK